MTAFIIIDGIYINIDHIVEIYYIEDGVASEPTTYISLSNGATQSFQGDRRTHLRKKLVCIDVGAPDVKE